MKPDNAQKEITQPFHDEQIMVVKRSHLFEDAAWNGIRTADLDGYLEKIFSHHTFMPRSLMEVDPTYKQIIPYLIFTHNNNYFLMQRQANATEQRLRNKMSLGIGGHLRKEDIQGTDFFAWAFREFHEEVEYTGTIKQKFVGLLNDDSNSVGQVHAGLVILIEGSTADIKVKSELKSGKLVSLQECSQHYDQLESWSQMVLDMLNPQGQPQADLIQELQLN